MGVPLVIMVTPVVTALMLPIWRFPFLGHLDNIWKTRGIHHVWELPAQTCQGGGGAATVATLSILT